MKKLFPILIGIGLLVLLAFIVVICRDAVEPSALETELSSTKATVVANAASEKVSQDVVSRASVETESAEGDEAIEDAEEQVSAEDAFDAEVDRWMEPKKGGVTVKDVDAFRAAFGRVPKQARGACLQRALNLIPDENVLLLAGILLDKTQDREVLDAVFSDVLNRDESVKTEILKTIHKDKSHPCWADTAWILDVTGEKP